MLAGCSGCVGSGGGRHISLPGDVIGKSKMGDVTSVTTGALPGADRSVVMCWKKTPAAVGGGACSGNDMAVLLTVAGATAADAAGHVGGGAWIPGLGRGVSCPAANIAACGDAAIKTGAPAASDDRMTGRAVS